MAMLPPAFVAASQPSLGYRRDVDGLRALAIVPVVLFHAGIAGCSGGYIGVDVFFVISGFLITALIAAEVQRGEFSFAGFYRRRVRRLLPTIAVVLACTLAAGFQIMTPADYARLLRTAAATLLFASNFHFAKKGGYFDDEITADALLHTWSLSVEEQFYLLWPVLLLVGLRYAPDKVTRIVAVSIVALFVAGIAAVHFNNFSAFFLPQTRAWQLLLGAWLALRSPRATSRLVTDCASIAGLAGIATSIVWLTSDTIYPGWWSAIPTISAALVIWSSQQTPSIGGRLLSQRPLVAIGLISYAWYLWHWPMLVLARYWVIRELTTTEAIALVTLSAGLATVCYLWLETPVRQGRFVSRQWTFLAAAGTTATLFAFAIIGIRTQGFAARHNDVAAIAGRGIELVAAEFSACSFGADNSPIDSPPCLLRQGKAGNRTLLLWGDSHANSVASAFLVASAATDDTIHVASQGGCLPLVGVSLTFSTRGHMSACLRRNAAMPARASDLAVTDVLLAARWNTYLLGPPPYGYEARARRLFVTDGRTIVRSTEESLRLASAALSETVREFARRNIRVWLMEEVPYAEQPVANLLARATINRVPIERIATIPREPHRQRADVVRNLIETLPAGERPRLLDPSAELCDQLRCKVIERGQPLYSDTNHLTVLGGRMLVPMAGRVLAP